MDPQFSIVQQNFKSMSDEVSHIREHGANLYLSDLQSQIDSLSSDIELGRSKEAQITCLASRTIKALAGIFSAATAALILFTAAPPLTAIPLVTALLILSSHGIEQFARSRCSKIEEDLLRKNQSVAVLQKKLELAQALDTAESHSDSDILSVIKEKSFTLTHKEGEEEHQVQVCGSFLQDSNRSYRYTVEDGDDSYSHIDVMREAKKTTELLRPKKIFKKSPKKKPLTARLDAYLSRYKEVEDSGFKCISDYRVTSSTLFETETPSESLQELTFWLKQQKAVLEKKGIKGDWADLIITSGGSQNFRNCLTDGPFQAVLLSEGFDVDTTPTPRSSGYSQHIRVIRDDQGTITGLDIDMIQGYIYSTMNGEPIASGNSSTTFHITKANDRTFEVSHEPFVYEAPKSIEVS